MKNQMQDRTILDWPFPECNRDTWVESTERTYWQLLECLPPEFYIPSGFVVGEPADHAGDGMPIHTACLEIVGRYFFREVRLDQAKKLAREFKNDANS